MKVSIKIATTLFFLFFSLESKAVFQSRFMCNEQFLANWEIGLKEAVRTDSEDGYKKNFEIYYSAVDSKEPDFTNYYLRSPKDEAVINIALGKYDLGYSHVRIQLNVKNPKESRINFINIKNQKITHTLVCNKADEKSYEAPEKMVNDQNSQKSKEGQLQTQQKNNSVKQK